MSRFLSGFAAPTYPFVRGWARASLISNIAIVLTGVAVRLTASGLGCPTWPRCTDSSFVPHSALGVHGVIEFGNRLLTYVLVAVALATWFAVRRWTTPGDHRRRLATCLALGIPAQALIGGITVLTDLNPWIVALHLLLSMALIAVSTLLLARIDAPSVSAIPVATRRLVLATYAAVWAVLYVGTVVTGSGPHAGDLGSPRNGLDPQVLSHVHATLVYLLVTLTVASVVVLRRQRPRSRAVALAQALLVVELAQGAIGFVQYATDVPIVLVWFHLLGASVLVAVATWFVVATRTADSAPPSSPRLGTKLRVTRP